MDKFAETNTSNNAPAETKPRAQNVNDEPKPAQRGGKGEKKQQYAKKQPQSTNQAPPAKPAENTATFVDSAIIAQPA